LKKRLGWEEAQVSLIASRQRCNLFRLNCWHLVVSNIALECRMTIAGRQRHRYEYYRQKVELISRLRKTAGSEVGSGKQQDVK
jgi:hypothetical protein